MNKKIFACILCILVTLGLFAQDGGGRRGGWGGQRRTVEERVAMIHQKFDSVYHFAADKQAKVDSAFAEQYRAQEKLTQEARAANPEGGKPDPAVMEGIRDKMQELGVARDEKLQGILTAEEYKKWKDEIEPAMRPRRSQGNGEGKPKEEGKN